MIQLLIRFGKWLEMRFPRQVVVLEADYMALKARIENMETGLKDIQSFKARLENVEKSAVHVGAVQELIKAMAQMKAELVSLRAGIGITASASSPEAVEAMLNGEFIKTEGMANG